MTSVQTLYKNGKIKKSPDNLSLFSVLQSHAQNAPKKEALVFADLDTSSVTKYTHQSLLNTTLSLARFLKETYHLLPGDAVALNLENSPEILFFHLACWLLGCITVPLDLKRDDVERKKYKIEKTHCKLFVTQRDAESKAEGEKISATFSEMQVYVLEQNMLERLEKKPRLPVSMLHESAQDTCLILFTSGTTAFPKGVQLSLTNLLLNAEGIQKWLKITQQDRFHIVLPLHHINSTTMSLATMLAGGTVVLSSRYSKSRFWQIMADHHCTISSIVPTICFDLLTEQKSFTVLKKKLRQVTRIQIGSAPVQPLDVIKFFDLYNIFLVQGYGSTETALRVTGVDINGLSVEAYKALVLSNAIGSELYWNNADIIQDDGVVAEEKEVGEICLRGPVLTKGYLDDDAANREAFVEGWFHSGDLGFWKNVDGKKVLFTTGRKKEIIIKGGVNISPLLVEHALLKQYPMISMCHVVGIQDKRYGEDIAAVVSCNDTLTDVQKREVLEKVRVDAKTGNMKGISQYESPKIILEISSDSLPKTSTGKVQRIKIKEYLADMYSPITETDTHVFMKLTPFNGDDIKMLTHIHNARWGKHLGISEDTAMQAVQNGIVIAAINKLKHTLEGSVFLLRMKTEDVEHLAPSMQTYDLATGNLTLKPNNEMGDCILLVSISTSGKSHDAEKIEKNIYSTLLSAAPKYIQTYLKSVSDPVLSFHMKPKAGMEGGAKILHVIERGRPEDVEAMGYNVVMKYPQLSDVCKVDAHETIGTQLIEAAFVYGIHHHIYSAYAYSRPSGFAVWLETQLHPKK